jgi:hypothetical protein
VSAVGILLVAPLTGCDFVRAQSADTWSVSYEISLDGKTVNVIKAASYDEAPSRGLDSETIDMGDVPTTNSAYSTEKASWTHVTTITAERRASVSGTAPAGSVATCRILLDGSREIAKNTGAPGGTVSCAAETPKFDKK